MLRQVSFPVPPSTSLRAGSPQSPVKTLSLSLLSAILLILPFTNNQFWLCAWFGFVPVFFALKNKSKKEAFLLFFITGIIFWSGTIYWLAHVTLAGTIVLILYLALYFAFFALIISNTNVLSKLSLRGSTFASLSAGVSDRSNLNFKIASPSARNDTSYNLLFIPSVWVLLEYIRGHLFTGFPWVLLGYSQYRNLAVIQIADITGAWGVSFLVMFVNVAIYTFAAEKPSAAQYFAPRNRRASGAELHSAVSKIKKIIPAIVILALVLSYGYYKISPSPLVTASPAGGSRPSSVKISVIQGNIPQELKWNQEYSKSIFDRYADLTRAAAQDQPQLIVWPEAAAPGILGQDDKIFQDIFSLAKSVDTPLVIGAVIEDKELFFGSALLINRLGEIDGRYDKLHLVPFGEYIPLKKQLPFLQTIVPIGDIERGREYTIFSLQAPGSRLQAPGEKPQAVRFAVLDCFEDVFPELAREFSRRGAEFLINITNDAWYKETSAPWQHLQASVFRAIENRKPLARAANTGVSGFIAPTGKIISLVQGRLGKNIFISGFKTEELKILRNNYSFYTRWGDIFILACFLMAAYGIIRAQKK